MRYFDFDPNIWILLKNIRFDELQEIQFSKDLPLDRYTKWKKYVALMKFIYWGQWIKMDSVSFAPFFFSFTLTT